jgi:hypothetical protein
MELLGTCRRARQTRDENAANFFSCGNAGERGLFPLSITAPLQPPTLAPAILR